MLLHSGPSLAEVPDLSPQQLDSLTCSIAQKKQRLEDDIKAYINRKQDELRNYEHELVEQCRAMECAEGEGHDSASSDNISPTDVTSSSNSQLSQGSHDSQDGAEPSRPADESTHSNMSVPVPGVVATAKRTKHTRVHKREKELCGLVTPIFLPLLEARHLSPTKKRKEKKRPKDDKSEVVGSAHAEPGSSRDSDKEAAGENHKARNKSRHASMETDESAAVAGESSKAAQKKPRQIQLVKKSSLRRENSPRPMRKRVSLVIDGQTVLPADTIVETPSPSDVTDSPASLPSPTKENIDPRYEPIHDVHVHQDPVHHSLPLPASLSSTSPTGHTGHTLFDSPGTDTIRLYDPFTSSSTPIYPNDNELIEEEESRDVKANDLDSNDFDTYVGGISGSGVDNVNQTGSYGYPSSLGASYLESYMKSRPMSVRLQAAEKAELDKDERRALTENNNEDSKDVYTGSKDDDEDMEVIGDMDGF